MAIIKVREHGEKPFPVALIHGGPGAAGEMGSLAALLKSHRGVLEPWQSESTLEGQVAELQSTLYARGELPLTLVGFSWGAWLSLMVAARFPEIVSKLILVGCGPLEERYRKNIEETRFLRLSPEQRSEIAALGQLLADPSNRDKNRAFARFGALYAKADAFDPVEEEMYGIDYRVDIYMGVWPEAAHLRKKGGLLALAKRLTCPVVAIHGDYDPHPAEGVRGPLSLLLKNFRFILIERCGHKPWIERQARDEFLRILEQELP